jgi:flagellar operon protein
MTPITNPALVPPLGGTPGGLSAPVAPARPGAVERAPRTPAGAPTGAPPNTTAPSFADQLSKANDGVPPAHLQFSKHALARVERRGIQLDQGTLGRLSQGVDRAAGKGSRDSLVLVDGTAFVVSVSNRTVITAVGSEHMKDNVFTNIDSAVIA